MAETASGARDYRRESGLKDAFGEFFRRYLDFGGRSNRGEYWYWVLDSILISIVLSFVDQALFGGFGDNVNVLGGIWGLATFIPSIALGVRRLHDIGRTGWWLLIILVPVIGFLVLLYFAVQPPEDGENRFG